MDIICEYRNCTGCQACKNACPVDAISMIENERGFFYPAVNQEICINCSKCQKACPTLNRRMDFNEPLKVLAGWIKDADVRHYSTSGGAAYAISKKIIEEGGVVCGCRWNKDHAEHAFAESISDLRQFQGSKYAQSDMGECFKRTKKYLDNEHKVLFVGTGCHVAGLKSFLGKDYDNLITVDLLCHGVPSQKVLRERIQTVEQKNEKKVVEMRFRDKREDQVHTYCKYTFEDGNSVYHAVQHDVFYRGFDGNYLLRPNCFRCQYAQSKRVSDITLADFWGYTPEQFRFINYRQGVSLLLVNTEIGEKVIDGLDDFVIEERQYSQAKRGNPNLNGPQTKPEKYEEFWQRYMTGESLDILSQFFFPSIPVPPVIKEGWKAYVRIAIGQRNISKIKDFVRRCFR